MRSNQITVTYPKGSADIRAELSRLKALQGINASAFCRLWIERGLQEAARDLQGVREDPPHPPDHRRVEEVRAGPQATEAA